MKKTVCILLSVLMLLGALPFAASGATIVDSGYCGAEGDGSNLTWTLDSDGLLTISGNGEMELYDGNSSPWFNNTAIKTVVIQNGVTSISGFAFYKCSGLTSATIPDSVTYISWHAFQLCSNLTSVTIGAGVTSIGNVAFSGCARLTSVTIPDSVTNIGYMAFAGCTGLTNLTVDSNNPVYFSAGNCIIEKESRTLVVGCKNSVIPNDGRVTGIGSSAFDGCTGLTSVTIPDSVTNIGYMAFANCTGLTNLTVDSNNPVYCSAGNCIIEKDSKTLMAGCNNSVIPGDGSVTTIGDMAFYGCAGLKSVTIPDSVMSIGSCAFEGCAGLASIVIPASVTEIGWSVIPKSTVIYGYIGSYAQQWAEENNQAFAPIGDAAVTLRAPEVVNQPYVNTFGFANPGADVVCSVNGTKTVTVQAAASGRWDAVLPLTGAKDGDSFTIKAVVTADGKTAEQTAAVTYKPDAVVFRELTLNHRCYSVTVEGERLGVSKPNITYIPGNPLSFKIKVSNSDRVDKLYVVSTKEETGKRMELTYNEATGCWFADGFFDAADKNYVPGVLTITGVDKDGKDFDAGATIKINFLIDPSGYAYEGVLSNKLEGVTAAVYYKDEAGHELLWNAETADQLNPVTTLSDGAFAWVVPEGEWQVRLTKPGYLEARSAWMEVPPEQTDVYIAMAASAAPEVAYCNVYADRAEITFSQYMDVNTVTTENVTFDGYTGTIKPLDAEELGEGSGIWYAKTFSFTPDKAFAGEINVKIENAANYVGTALTAPYTATFTVAAEPKNLTAAQDVTVKYGKTAEIAVSAENAAGKIVSVACDSANITLSAKTLTLDETGKATLTVTGDMPGTAKLTFSLDGTTMKATSTVTVAISEKPTEPAYIPGDVDGNGKVESADARLALRASVKLETYAEGSAKFLAADYDKNGKIESADARAILRVSVKLDPFG